MSAFSEAIGTSDTAREISQQPAVWPRVLDLLERRKAGDREILSAAGKGTSIILAGAGSSDYVGRSVAASLRARLRCEVAAVPTTHLVTHPVSRIGPEGRPVLFVHFARSGDSPESLAAWRLLRRARPEARHVVITCNHAGALAREAGADPSALLLTLPPETNDRSLAMTSSFTSMALCAIGLGWVDELPLFRRRMTPVCDAAQRIIESEVELINAFAGRRFDRLCCLGSDSLQGAMDEGALKMLELTAGQVTAIGSSFLGIRHGPLVFINGTCAVVACLSSDARVRRYETDLLRELRRRRQGAGILAICSQDDDALGLCADLPVLLGGGTEEIPDDLRVLTDIVVCQVLAFSKSRLLGLTPDNPSPDGVISRVVQGVTIYD